MHPFYLLSLSLATSSALFATQMESSSATSDAMQQDVEEVTKNETASIEAPIQIDPSLLKDLQDEITAMIEGRKNEIETKKEGSINAKEPGSSVRRFVTKPSEKKEAAVRPMATKAAAKAARVKTHKIAVNKAKTVPSQKSMNAKLQNQLRAAKKPSVKAPSQSKTPVEHRERQTHEQSNAQ